MPYGNDMRIVAGLLLLLCIGGIMFLRKEGNDSKRIEPLSRVEVLLTDGGFEPREIYIAAGDTITFSTNRNREFWPASNLHPQHDIYPEFDPERPLAPTEKWSFSFPRKGTFGYHDHLRAYFNGVIYVE